MHHLVLNSGSILRFPLASLQTRLPRFCSTLVDGKGGTLPGVPEWRTIITREPGCAVFDIRSKGRSIISINAIAWTEKGAARVWKQLEKHYLDISKMVVASGVANELEPPVMPTQTPWLATWILPPGAQIRHCQFGFLADLERKIAAAILH